MTKIIEIANELNEIHNNEKQVTFPINYIGDGKFKTSDDYEFQIHESAINTLRMLTRFKYVDEYEKERYDYHYSFSQLKEAHENNDWLTFSNLFNHKTTIERVVKKNNKYVGIFSNNLLIGIYKNYNFISNESLMYSIKEYGLSNRIIDYVIEPNKMILFLSMSTDELESFGDFDCSIVLSNYFDGWQGIKYNALIKIFDEELEYKFKNSNKRHLSNVNELVSSLGDVLEDLSKKNIPLTLSQLDGHEWFLSLERDLGNKNDKYVEFFSKMSNIVNSTTFDDGYNCLFLLKVISKIMTQHGFKMVGKAVGEWLLKEVLNI